MFSFIITVAKIALYFELCKQESKKLQKKVTIFSSLEFLAPAAVAEVRLYHWEDFAPEAALKIGGFFCSWFYSYKRKCKHAGVVYLVDDAVEKLRGCRGLSYDHQGLSVLVARVGEPVVQLSALHVIRGCVEYLVRGAEPPKVPDDLSGPVAAQRYIYAEGPVVLWHVYGLYVVK